MTAAGTFRRGAALLIFISLLGVAAFFGLTRDRLLFHSDAWSLSLTLAFLALAGAAGPAVLWAALCAARKPLARRAEEGLAALALLALTMAFPTVCLGMAALALRLDWALRLIRSPGALAAVLLALVLAAAYVAFRARDRRLYRARTRQVAAAISLLALFAVPVGTAANHLGRAGVIADARQLTVLLVLDGLPARYMRRFGWNAPETELDRLFAQADLQVLLRSSSPFTFGWFGTLYSGSSKAVLSPLERVDAPDNLLARIQRSGAAARWIAFHQNGIPEASAGHVSAYAGLRSSFLTPRYAWIPRLLGLDYHLVLPNPAIRSLLVGPVARVMFRSLNPDADQPVLAYEALLREADRLSAEGRGGLLIVHTYWESPSQTKPPAQRTTDNPLWSVEDNGVVDPDNYYYPEAAEDAIAGQRMRLTEKFEALGHELRTLRNRIRSLRHGARIQLLVTADHGSAYEQGRLNYGVHPIEAVLDVPLLIFGGNRLSAETLVIPVSGDGPMDTRDLSAMLARNGESEAAGIAHAPTGIQSGDGKSHAASVTLRSDRKAEWFVVLARGQRVIRANIHPASDGQLMAFRKEGYDARPLALTGQQRQAARRAVARSLPEFGIAFESVHSAYRNR